MCLVEYSILSFLVVLVVVVVVVPVLIFFNKPIPSSIGLYI